MEKALNVDEAIDKFGKHKLNDVKKINCLSTEMGKVLCEVKREGDSFSTDIQLDEFRVFHHGTCELGTHSIRDVGEKSKEDFITCY